MLAVEHALLRASFGRAPEGAEGGAGGGAALDGAAEAARASLAACKAAVPEAIARHGRSRWDAAVAAPGATEHAARGVDAISRAFHKLHEIFLSCAIAPPRRSMHLCEAPGGFVQATHHLAASEGADGAWSWRAISLPPSRGRYPTPARGRLPLGRGRFVEGDVLDVEAAAAALLAPGEEAADGGAADLVTADGAVEMDHARLEEEHLPLLRAQVDVALRVLAPGGTLVVKCFEVLTRGTCEVVAQLTHRFESVSLIKPTSSRPTNSERYIVARRRLADDGAPLEAGPLVVSEAWRAHLAGVSARMAEEQTRAMRGALERVVRMGGRGGVPTAPAAAAR